MRLVLVLAAAWLGLAGCAGQTGDGAAPSGGPGAGGEAGMHALDADPAGMRDESGGPNAPERRPVFDEATADRLEKLAESVQGVKGATCVVLGNVAIVGIDVDGSLDRGRVGSVKYAVAEALAKDPAGVRAAVTADLDIRSRLKGIRARVEEGRPIRGLAEQFAELIGRMMPQLPRDTAPRAEPEGHPDDRQNLGRQRPQTP